MTYEEIEPLLKLGKIGMLPHFKGYFHWRFGINKPFMRNGNYETFDIEEQKKRKDWFYII